MAYHNFLRFTSCHFKGNYGYGGGDGGAHDTGGGGAICMVGSTLELLACLFEDNVATDPPPSTGKAYGTTGTHHGGAVMNIEGHIVARDSSFIRGNAHQGGALYTWMWGTISAKNCSFINNTAIGASHNTGGAIFTDRGSAVISESLFEGNIANMSGGAIFGWSASGSCKNVTNTTFSNTANTTRMSPHTSAAAIYTSAATTSSSGGAPCVHGIACICQNVTITKCSFIRNVAVGGSKGKGGVGGAVSNQWSTFNMTGNICEGSRVSLRYLMQLLV